MTDLSNIDTDDLREELESRGYNVFDQHVYEDLHDFDSADLIDAVENLGYIVVEKDDSAAIYSIEDLYQFKRMNDPRFEEAFSDYVYNAIGKII